LNFIFPTQDRIVRAIGGLFKLPATPQGPVIVLDAGCGTGIRQDRGHLFWRGLPALKRTDRAILQTMAAPAKRTEDFSKEPRGIFYDKQLDLLSEAGFTGLYCAGA
jgi:hypothetical protein